MIRQAYGSSSSTMGDTQHSDKQRKKNPHRSRGGISPECLHVCAYALASSCTHVLLSLIITDIHHNKSLNNSQLQNKGTSLCMLKNKWPHKWWMRGWQTKKGYYSVSNSHSFHFISMCFESMYVDLSYLSLYKEKLQTARGTKHCGYYTEHFSSSQGWVTAQSSWELGQTFFFFNTATALVLIFKCRVFI